MLGPQGSGLSRVLGSIEFRACRVMDVGLLVWGLELGDPA